jgi:hypothetical protein
MQATKITVYEDDGIGIECPSCENWEEINVDTPRHKVQTFNLIEWETDEEDKNEVSIMKCCVCKSSFMLEWDYSNLEP